MRKIVGSLALGGALLMATAPIVSANDSTCSELFGYPHGYHVIADYVTGTGSEFLGGPGIDWPPKGVNAAGGAVSPGAPGAGHMDGGVAPGASFCNSQSQSPGFHVPG